jgi:hypothetical protein
MLLYDLKRLCHAVAVKAVVDVTACNPLVCLWETKGMKHGHLDNMTSTFTLADALLGKTFT